MPRVVRHNLSGGELGEPLWTRSDLDAYHKGNKIQKNFISTVYGGIERRPPSKVLWSPSGSSSFEVQTPTDHVIFGEHTQFSSDRHETFVASMEFEAVMNINPTISAPQFPIFSFAGYEFCSLGINTTVDKFIVNGAPFGLNASDYYDKDVKFKMSVRDGFIVSASVMDIESGSHREFFHGSIPINSGVTGAFSLGYSWGEPNYFEGTVSSARFWLGNAIGATVYEGIFDFAVFDRTTYRVPNLNTDYDWGVIELHSGAVTPEDVWGALGGMKSVLAEIGAVRGFSFVYSAKERYSVLMVEYLIPDQPSRISMEIISVEGVLKASLEIPYSGEHFFELDYKQVNDVLMFTHNLYPPARLERHSDTDWRFGGMRMEGGPYEDRNSDGTKELENTLSSWYPDVNYTVGDEIAKAGTVGGVMSWAGTHRSFLHDTLRSGDLPSDDRPSDFEDELVWTTAPTYYESAEPSGGDIYHIYYMQPVLLVRVEGDIPYASIGEMIGLTVKLDSVMLTTNTPYAVSGKIRAVYQKSGDTSFHYLSLDVGMYVILMFRYASFGIDYCDVSDYVNAPVITITNEDWFVPTNTEYYRGLDSADIIGSKHKYSFLFGAGTVGGGVFRQDQGENLRYDGTGAYHICRQPHINRSLNDTRYWTPASTSAPSTAQLSQMNAIGFSPFSLPLEGTTLTRDDITAITESGSWTASNRTSAENYVTGVVVLTTEGGTWSGEIAMETKRDGSNTWENIGSVVSTGDSNGKITRTITGRGTKVRIHMITYNTGVCKWHMEAPSGYSIDYTIVKYLNPTSAVVRVITGSHALFRNYVWAFSAMGGVKGYPARLTVHEERLIIGGTLSRPFEFYGSEVNNWTNFAVATLANSPIVFRLQADNVTQIKWLLSRSSQLYIGTDFGEYVATTPDKDTVLSGENPPRITLITPYGSDLQSAIAVHDEVVHVVGDRRTVRALTQKEYTQADTSKSLTIFSPAITRPSIKEIHLQRNPYAVIWAVREDGGLISFTYDVENGIMGWAKMDLGDYSVRTHWIIPSEQGIDEVYFVSSRNSEALRVVSDPSDPPSVDVSGEYDLLAGGGIEGSGIVITSTNGDDYAIPYYDMHEGRPSFSHQNYGGIAWNTTNWYASTSFQPPFSHATGDGFLPPKGGWPVGSPATMTVDYTGIFESDSYMIDVGTDGYSIYDKITGKELFTCAELYGKYVATATSGETGSVIVKDNRLRVSKFDLSDEIHEGAEDYESLVEFTSLVQGNGILTRNVVRATRVLLYLVESQGGQVSVDGGDTWVNIEYDDASLYTGHKEVRVNSGNVEDLRILVKASGIKPFQLTGIGVDIDKETTTRRYD